MAIQWDYKVLKIPTDFGFFSGTDFDTAAFEAQLVTEGNVGWELVSVFDIDKVKGGSKYVVAVMKRPK